MAFKYTAFIVCTIALSCHGQSYEQVSIYHLSGFRTKKNINGLEFVFHAIETAREH